MLCSRRGLQLPQSNGGGDGAGPSGCAGREHRQLADTVFRCHFELLLLLLLLLLLSLLLLLLLLLLLR
jgi:hypothetical protein